MTDVEPPGGAGWTLCRGADLSDSSDSSDAESEGAADPLRRVPVAARPAPPCPAPESCQARTQLAELVRLYEEDKTLQSYALLSRVQEELQAAHRCERTVAAARRLAEDPTVQKIRAEAQRVANLRQTLSSDDGWTLTSVSNDGVRTLFRDDDQTRPFHLFRVEGLVEAPLLHLLAVLCEIDLWPQWMVPPTPLCAVREARVLGRARPTHFLCYLGARMPWPVDDRDLPLEVKAIDCMDHDEKYRRQIVVLLNSCTSFPETDIPSPAHYVRAQLRPSGVLLTPIIPTDGGPIRKTYVQLVVCINPKVVFLPAWVMNLFMRNLVFLFIPALRNRVPEVARADSIYRERVARHPDLYGYLARRMRECFPAEPAGLWPDS